MIEFLLSKVTKKKKELSGVKGVGTGLLLRAFKVGLY